MNYWVVELCDGEYVVLMADFDHKSSAISWAIAYANEEKLDSELFVIAVEKKSIIRRQAVAMEQI